jgi:hypothetical protein
MSVESMSINGNFTAISNVRLVAEDLLLTTLDNHVAKVDFPLPGCPKNMVFVNKTMMPRNRNMAYRRGQETVRKL